MYPKMYQMKSTLILASSNPGKISELRALLPSDTLLKSLDDIGWQGDIEEPFDTFAENAMHKASTIYRYCGLPTLADDSGLQVDALRGAPGVYSARYAGASADSQANMLKLLAELEGERERSARFVSVLACIGDHRAQTYEGTCEGYIAQEQMGEGGFGYDPIFIPQGYELTFGQLSKDIKNSLSHRAEAIAKFLSDYSSGSF